MAGAAVVFDNRQVVDFIKAIESFGHSPEAFLRDFGIYYTGETKRHFQAAAWPKKPPHWEYWEGNKTAPLTYRGRLMGSITWDMPGLGGTRPGLRVGSPLPYAATHQFGAPSRIFSIWLKPDMEPGARPGTMRIARFPNGLPKGRLVLAPSPGQRLARQKKLLGQGKSAAEAFHHSQSSFERGGETIIRVRIRQRILARPFLHIPSDRQWSEIGDIAFKHMLGKGGKA